MTATTTLVSEVTTQRNLEALADEIRKRIWQDCEDPRLRELAAHIIRKYDVKSRDPRTLARAFQQFAQQQVSFFREFPEINAAPWVTAAWKLGDCDDKSRLIAALAKSFRIPVRLVFITFRSPKRPGPVSHVWPEVDVGQGWEALESVQPWPMGKSALDLVKLKQLPYKAFTKDI